MSAGSHPLEARFGDIYRAFNDRDADWLLAQMTEDVDWPNAWEGGRVLGRAAVRAYWMRQWASIDPRVEPQRVSGLPDGRVAVHVHQAVRAFDGTVLSDGHVRHTYSYRDGLIARMEASETQT